jgi:3-oxoacyl-[acyl-carrier-protein] synthase-3
MSFADTYVDHLSFALGEHSYGVEQSAAEGRLLSEPSLLREAGFQQHHICGPTTSAYQMAQQAVANIENALGRTNAIVYSTCLPGNGTIGSTAEYERSRDVKHLMDFPASHLQADFNLTNAQVFGLNQQACTGMLGSIRMARMLLLTEPLMDSVLCVTADKFPHDAIYEQAYCLISDGAAGCIVSNTPKGFRVLAGHGITNGALACASDDETVGTFFNYSYKTIQETLQRANLKITDIDWIVPQNTNTKAWQILANLLRVPFERVCSPTLAQVGHVISGDNIINLKALLETVEVKPHQRILLFMAGFGLNWQCLILEKV